MGFNTFYFLDHLGMWSMSKSSHRENLLWQCFDEESRWDISKTTLPRLNNQKLLF